MGQKSEMFVDRLTSYSTCCMVVKENWTTHITSQCGHHIFNILRIGKSFVFPKYRRKDKNRVDTTTETVGFERNDGTGSNQSSLPPIEVFLFLLYIY